ncbi:LysR family transcriptional regulator [Massilia sp. W12]|uniref:LysR family transcriptional regulator n=1 Tax=Massilia sp. W12 TaxID=3126507 RepID=UPI0030CD240C
MALDLIDVALFVRVAATRNLSAAGREFGLSPAASSARMAQLEKQLHARLLLRSTRKIMLSQEGEQFLPAAQALLEAADAAEMAIQGSQPQGLLRVAVSASFGRQHLGPLLPGFLRAYPAISLDLRLSDAVVDMIAEGIDVAIRLGALRDSNLVARQLAPNRRVLCASPAYLAAHGAPQTPADLAKHECLILNAQRDWRFAPRWQDGPEQAVRVSGRLNSDNYEILSAAALDGMGVQIKALWDAAPLLRSGQLQEILPDWRISGDSFIWAVYPGRKLAPGKTEAFIHYLQGHFGPQPYWEAGLPAQAPA